MTAQLIESDSRSGEPWKDRHRRGWVLAAASVASFMVSLDLLVVTTSLDTIRRDLGTSTGSLQWIVTAYGVSFAALLLTGAALGDRFGRRRTAFDRQSAVLLSGRITRCRPKLSVG
mgnify:CR=1 FL=1